MFQELNQDVTMTINGGFYPQSEKNATTAGDADPVVRGIIITAGSMAIAAVTATTAPVAIISTGIAIVTDKLLNRKY